ncbi:MAG TPA: DedA family protein [Gammaproteobacteria bacterium]|nr:DedA family protein [Gammaproteobacteria bacterium]
MFQEQLKLLEPYLSAYGYPVLFMVIFIESFGIPAPGQTLLIASALLAAHGKLSIALVLMTAFFAAVAGDSLGYWIGMQGGRRLLLRFGRYVRIGRREIRKMERAFNRFGGWFVTFARFFEVLRQVNGIVAGTMEMPFRRFLMFNGTGALLWVTVWGFGTWRLGTHMRGFENVFEQAGTLLFIAGVAVLLIVLLVINHHWRNSRKS